MAWGRTLSTSSGRSPEKLTRLNSAAAYETLTGGLLGVVRQQMEDANEAAD
jgi:hypothetical protein